jgi:adenosine phosphosulfate reductase beta subunit
MPTFVYMTRCDGCGQCVDICPSDIMHIDPVVRRAYNIEPNMCWECYSCVKACPHNAIDVRGYADFAPLGHSVRVKRQPTTNGHGTVPPGHMEPSFHRKLESLTQVTKRNSICQLSST